MFLELDVDVVQILLRRPSFSTKFIEQTKSDRKEVKYVYMEQEKMLTQAANVWIDHNTEERKNYKDVLMKNIYKYLYEAMLSLF